MNYVFCNVGLLDSVARSFTLEVCECNMLHVVIMNATDRQQLLIEHFPTEADPVAVCDLESSISVSSKGIRALFCFKIVFAYLSCMESSMQVGINRWEVLLCNSLMGTSILLRSIFASYVCQ